jgi:hypothetical protein
MKTFRNQDNAGAVKLSQDSRVSPSSLVATKTSVHEPASATRATTTVLAVGTGIRHVCSGVTVTLAAGATAQTPVHVRLIDGASGGSVVLWSAVLSVPVNSCAVIELPGLAIEGSLNTAMTLEFENTAPATGVFEDVTLHYYDIEDVAG